MEKREQLRIAIKEALLRNREKTKDKWLSRVADAVLRCYNCPASEYCEKEVEEEVHGCADTICAWLKED